MGRALARLKTRLKGMPFYGALREAWQLAHDPRHRRARWLQLRRPRHLFQPFGTTREDRYPAIFRCAREALGDGPELRILSFGCSTGEEVFSLRRHFAAAFITGIDIDPRNIAICNRRLAQAGDVNMAFRAAASTADEAAQSYDAIFCMAVLRHGGLARDAVRSDPLIRFEDFERAVADFARCLRPGGILALRHSNFRFRDAAASQDFETLLSVRHNPATPLFGRDNRRLAEVPPEIEAVFRKRPCGHS
jgi:2-polyprenyl-3-methyl-5-hydroxy-6-metoxy-1,4-benzoquinol methylase